MQVATRHPDAFCVVGICRAVHIIVTVAPANATQSNTHADLMFATPVSEIVDMPSRNTAPLTFRNDCSIVHKTICHDASLNQ